MAKERSDSTILNLKQINSFKNLNQKTFPALKRFPYSVTKDSDLNAHLHQRKSSSCAREDKETLKTNKLIKLFKCSIRKLEEEKIMIKTIQEINIEWKEVARRLEYIFLVFSFVTIIVAPLVLFGKFYVRDFINKKTVNPSCSCAFSFV